jgi:glutamyl-tRNA reductase
MISRLSPAKSLKHTESVIKFIENKRNLSYIKTKRVYNSARDKLKEVINTGSSSQANRLEAISKTLEGKTKENVEIVSSESLGKLAGDLKSYLTSMRYFADLFMSVITQNKTAKQKWFAQGEKDLREGIDALVESADAMKIEEKRSSNVSSAAGVIKVRYGKIEKKEPVKVGAKTHQEIIDEKLDNIEKGLGVTPPKM